MEDSYAGIAVPEGDPGALRDGAQQMRSTAVGLHDSARDLEGMPSTLGSWQGPASGSYAASCLSMSESASRAAEVWSASARAVDVFADALDDARRDSEAAIADAREAKRRIERCEEEMKAAQERLKDAEARADSARGRLAATGAAGATGPVDAEDLRQAEADIDEAERDYRRWRDERDEAERELERAQRRGNLAEQRARQAAKAADGALATIQAGMPQWVAPPAPALVPLGALGPARAPEEEGGFCGGWFGGALCDTGDFAGDVGHGLGRGAEEGFDAITHPGETIEGLAHSATHPADALEAIAHSCDGMSVGDCLGFVGVGAIGTKGTTAAASAARRGGPEPDAPEPSGSDARDSASPELPPNLEVRSPDGSVLFRTDGDGSPLVPLRELNTEIGDAREAMDRGAALSERLEPPSRAGHGTPPPNVRAKREALTEATRLVAKAIEDLGG